MQGLTERLSALSICTTTRPLVLALPTQCSQCPWERVPLSQLFKDSSQSHILGSVQKDSSLNRLTRQYAYSTAAPTHTGFDSEMLAFALVGLCRCPVIIYFIVGIQKAVGYQDVWHCSWLIIAHFLLCCLFLIFVEYGWAQWRSFSFFFFFDHAQVVAQLWREEVKRGWPEACQIRWK